MAIFTVTGDDTLVLDGRVFDDLSTGDVTSVTLPNELVNIKTGKNKNSLISLNNQGYNGQVTIRVNRGSSDDQFLNQKLAGMTQDFVGTALIDGSFTKRLGDGLGNVVNDAYSLQGGIISKIPEAKENVEGDTSQAETVYVIKFCNCGRAIG